MSERTSAPRAETLWAEARQVLETLQRNGFRAVFVGGCVRDRLLGRPVHDIDIATSALPEDVVSAFPRTVPTGLRHGTVTVLTEHHTYEVTTFRREADYEQYRRPKTVEFIPDLAEDLRRRDFTINAMAMDADGRLIDPFGGERDLADKVLRCVGNPRERFEEDALRMLRCIRFACEYGLAIDPETWDALLAHGSKLAYIAMERVRVELEKTLEGRDPARGVERLVASGLYRYFKEPLGFADEAWERLPGRCGRIGGIAVPAARWAAVWLGLGGAAETAKTAMRRLRFSTDKLEAVARILAFGEWLAARPPVEAKAIPERRWVEAVLRYGEEAAAGWLEWARAAGAEAAALTGLPAAVAGLLERGAQWTAWMPVRRKDELAVDGRQLAHRLGRRPGPWLGRLIDRLLLEAALGRLANERDALLGAAERLTAEEGSDADE